MIKKFYFLRVFGLWLSTLISCELVGDVRELKPGSLLVIRVKGAQRRMHIYQAIHRVLKGKLPQGIIVFFLKDNEFIDSFGPETAKTLCTTWLHNIKNDPELGDAAQHLLTLILRQKVSKALTDSVRSEAQG